ncbi:hypothetical protein CASFOL_000408 [Castilleja foliolosa]|uniref:Uncharacterized protein n=1 Tax=Castilleja foliolosa TaxID=1961234 RepID=A0ABD3ENL4_9LAMI
MVSMILSSTSSQYSSNKNNNMVMINTECSDSNCSNLYPQPSKRCRMDRFKGVVPQQNGHWGAQIYANHQRIWLGTFKSEADAAMAYDTAAIKLRSGDSHRNFPSSSNILLLETKFQAELTTDLVLSMIRDGSYPSKFADFLRDQQVPVEIGVALNLSDGFSCTFLFQKELTPSDVGKLNRLVIPKRYAVKHFPSVPERVEEVQLEFYDRRMSLWKFRYCYWKSSQSFVFTRGWNRFVKEKGLRANDMIAFYTCEGRGGRFGQSFLVIDVVSGAARNNHDAAAGDDGKKEAENVEILKSTSRGNNGSKGFRLFGVQID